MCIHNPGIQAALPCRRGHVGGGVNADDTCASSGNLGAQHPVAAAEIENAFTGSRIKQDQNLGAECRNLTGMFGVGIGRPGLRHDHKYTENDGLMASLDRRCAWRPISYQVGTKEYVFCLRLGRTEELCLVAHIL
jgi:hypothetical protein